MMQNLNLYQPGERVRQRGPNATHIISIFGALLGCLLLHGAWQAFRLQDLNAQVAVAEASAQSAEDALNTVSHGFVAPTLNAALPDEVADQQQANLRLSRVDDYLQVLERQRAKGFASVLQALSEQHLPRGLWLTAITLQQGGTRMRLQGLSQSQTLLPAYLDSLGRSKALAGRQFAQFTVERDPSGLFGFSLDSQAAEDDRK
jgi:Tfp pilus assembly protein PilN